MNIKSWAKIGEFTYNSLLKFAGPRRHICRQMVGSVRRIRRERRSSVWAAVWQRVVR